ncbi:N-methyl-D-aspartate receptor-associated protein, putative [Ichthyophthirius multifiliis]|uniref:N-methyl-D-aspartate receptor-associated protein, putative n=1 Tax=Ichthyophthirius multifiliis TaxID=5932 RepID=G0R4N7_ICHMU|nr:N-methyl-D-aspartate receptor-associated protein, putative [Ichthyophthirius multifiliis]EGR27543.1 N-methyl-D-aspartate receptor-associated protein, putative [Ichthyophthirius multifiliis]|eukprot:XP_004024995.1 N-methyl-D-aspartate receptor-associated protein, putative [Ichthyophthirius multifiliis]
MYQNQYQGHYNQNMQTFDVENPMVDPYQNQNNKKEKKHKKHRKSSESSQSSNSSDKDLNQNLYSSEGLSSDKYLRSGFVTKVYSILSVQMLFTVMMSAFSMSSDHFRMLQLNNQGLMILIIIVQIVVLLVLICSRDMAKKVPTNYILLGVFTFCEGYIVGFICAFTDQKLVFMAVFMTMSIFFALTLYACTTKSDFTLMGGFLCVLGMVLLILCLFMMFTNNKIIQIIYSSIAALMFGLYIIYDTQLIIGTKSYKYDIDDYVIASLELYMDIIGLFLQLLELLKALQSNNSE